MEFPKLLRYPLEVPPVSPMTAAPQILGDRWWLWLSPFRGPDGTGVEWGIEEVPTRWGAPPGRTVVKRVEHD